MEGQLLAVDALRHGFLGRTGIFDDVFAVDLDIFLAGLDQNMSVIKTFGTVEPIFYRRIWLILV